MGKISGHFHPRLYLFCYRLYQATLFFKAPIVNDSLLYPSCPPRNKGRWSILMVCVVPCLDDGMVLMNKGLLPRYMYLKQWQYLIVFILLTLNNVTSKNLLPQRCVLLEKGTLVLTVYVLLLLLVSHVQDSSGVELQIHSLLILVVFLLMLVLTVELWAPDTFYLLMIETLLFLLMGSWLIQAAFILYRPVTGYPWQDDDISDIMFITTFFCWHLMINALCLLGIYGVSFFWHRCHSPNLKLMVTKEAPYAKSTVGSLYKLLQEGEQAEKEEQALLLSKSSP
uniref:Transmembrane epididymal protein 1 n=1 Tax=Equus asinus asinus TaxID=83772 RepID=A0A8C4LAE4_EQUAS